jgi:putative N6-adenine-specific DNA methylase
VVTESGTTESFFLVIPVGLEAFAEAELLEKAKLLSKRSAGLAGVEVLSRSKGGLTIRCDRALGFALNHWLKIPTRILLRLAEFRCKDLPKLFNRVRKLPWQNYLRRGPVECSVSVHESRLKIKETIAESVREALRDCEHHQPFRKKFLDVPQNIFLRIKKDTVFVSIDTSGEALYKRGYKPFTAQAPMRENLAAGLLWPLLSSCPEGTIVDMMAGSGTLGFEALSFYEPVRGRKFAHENFPSVAEAMGLAPSGALKDCSWVLSCEEKDAKAFEVLSKNAEVFKKTFGSKNFGSLVTLHNRDVFTAELPPGAHLVCNPPYDERLAADTATLAGQFKELLKESLAKNRLASLSLVWPGLRPPDLGVKWASTVRTTNGGIPITLNFSRF